jgi:cysteine desulfurase
MRRLYFDNNATTQLAPQVMESMLQVMRQRLVNPASQHADGRLASHTLAAARQAVAASVGLSLDHFPSPQVILTSGGTEANNLAVLGLLMASGRPGPLWVTGIEHPSVLGAADELVRRGCRVERLEVDSDGCLCLETLERRLASEPPPAVAALMAANNETGVLQPVRLAAERLQRQGCLVHCDAVQWVGKLPCDFRDLGVDSLSLSAHKLHGPVGVGALLLRPEVRLAPQLWGGHQQLGLRPGTESVMLAVGLAQSLQLALSQLDAVERLAKLRDRLESELQRQLPDLRVLGGAARRLPNTSCLSLPGVDRQQLQMALDMAGISVSTGSACTSGSSQPSHVLEAMGLASAVVQGAIRVSLSRETTEDDVEQAITRMVAVWRRLARLTAGSRW